MRRAVRLLAVTAVLAVVAGCTPLYVPPVPSAPEIDEPLRIGRESMLVFGNEGLVAVLELSPVSDPGWLSLQWYDPALVEVASDSVWLEATGDTHDLRIGIPDHVVLRPGRWRLVLVYRGIVIRQLDTEVPPG